MALTGTQQLALTACLAADGGTLIKRGTVYRSAFIGGSQHKMRAIEALVRRGLMRHSGESTVRLTVDGARYAKEINEAARAAVIAYRHNAEARLARGTRMHIESRTPPKARLPYPED